jgi:hypothetical protein
MTDIVNLDKSTGVDIAEFILDGSRGDINKDALELFKDSYTSLKDTVLEILGTNRDKLQPNMADDFVSKTKLSAGSFWVSRFPRYYSETFFKKEKKTNIVVVAQHPPKSVLEGFVLSPPRKTISDQADFYMSVFTHASSLSTGSMKTFVTKIHDSVLYLPEYPSFSMVNNPAPEHHVAWWAFNSFLDSRWDSILPKLPRYIRGMALVEDNDSDQFISNIREALDLPQEFQTSKIINSQEDIVSMRALFVLACWRKYMLKNVTESAKNAYEGQAFVETEAANVFRSMFVLGKDDPPYFGTLTKTNTAFEKEKNELINQIIYSLPSYYVKMQGVAVTSSSGGSKKTKDLPPNAKCPDDDDDLCTIKKINFTDLETGKNKGNSFVQGLGVYMGKMKGDAIFEKYLDEDMNKPEDFQKLEQDTQYMNYMMTYRMENGEDMIRKAHKVAKSDELKLFEFPRIKMDKQLKKLMVVISHFETKEGKKFQDYVKAKELETLIEEIADKVKFFVKTSKELVKQAMLLVGEIETKYECLKTNMTTDIPLIDLFIPVSVRDSKTTSIFADKNFVEILNNNKKIKTKQKIKGNSLNYFYILMTAYLSVFQGEQTVNTRDSMNARSVYSSYWIERGRNLFKYSRDVFTFPPSGTTLAYLETDVKGKENLFGALSSIVIKKEKLCSPPPVVGAGVVSPPPVVGAGVIKEHHDKLWNLFDTWVRESTTINPDVKEQESWDEAINFFVEKEEFIPKTASTSFLAVVGLKHIHKYLRFLFDSEGVNSGISSLLDLDIVKNIMIRIDQERFPFSVKDKTTDSEGQPRVVSSFKSQPFRKDIVRFRGEENTSDNEDNYKLEYGGENPSKDYKWDCNVGTNFRVQKAGQAPPEINMLGGGVPMLNDISRFYMTWFEKQTGSDKTSQEDQEDQETKQNNTDGVEPLFDLLKKLKYGETVQEKLTSTSSFGYSVPPPPGGRGGPPPPPPPPGGRGGPPPPPPPPGGGSGGAASFYDENGYDADGYGPALNEKGEPLGLQRKIAPPPTLDVKKIEDIEKYTYFFVFFQLIGVGLGCNVGSFIDIELEEPEEQTNRASNVVFY